jgi:hypothetical protein
MLLALVVLAGRPEQAGRRVPAVLAATVLLL